jgi:hypothetical protein
MKISFKGIPPYYIEDTDLFKPYAFPFVVDERSKKPCL